MSITSRNDRTTPYTLRIESRASSVPRPRTNILRDEQSSSPSPDANKKNISMLPGTSHQILVNPSNLRYSQYAQDQIKHQSKNNVFVNEKESKTSHNNKDESSRQLFQYFNQNGAHVFVQQFSPKNSSQMKQTKRTKWADYKQNIERRAQMRKLQNNSNQLNIFTMGASYPANDYLQPNTDIITKQQPKQQISKLYPSKIARHSRMPSEIIVKSLNKTISTKAATPHVHNLYEQNIQSFQNNLRIEEDRNEKAKSISPTSTMYESRNFSQMFYRDSKANNTNNNNNKQVKEINSAYGNRIKRHYKSISNKLKGQNNDPIRVHIKRADYMQYRRKTFISKPNQQESPGKIGILTGKKKSLGPNYSGSEKLSLAKQNAQKIKNVVHRLSLSSKAPVLSKRQLKMMQDNQKSISYVPLKMTQKVLKPNFNVNQEEEQ